MSLAPLLGNWTGGDGPLYRQLADRIDELAQQGDLPPGARLPPERQLAEQLAVSRSTTVAAYALLAERGVVVRRQGSGTRITPEGHAAPGARLDDGGVNELFRPMLSDDVDVIDLASANRECAESVHRAFAELAGPELTALLATTGYTAAGLPRLRRALAEYYTKQGVPTDPGHILVTNGAQQSLSLVGQLLVGPGDAVITEEATYGGVLDVFRSAGARLFAARSDENGVDTRDLEQLVTRVRPALIYLVPTYQNPTGTVLPEGRRKAVVDIARRFHVPVVDDMVLSHLGMTGDRVPPPLAHYAETAPRDRRTDLVITVDSLAKIFWGGLRIGWLRAAPGLVNRLARTKTISDLGTSPVLQLVGARLLDEIDEATDTRSAQLRAGVEHAKGLLNELAPDWEFDIPHGGQVLWIKLPRGTARGLAAVALRHGVRIATGPALSPVETFDDHIRIPFTAAPAVLEEGIRRLTAAWAVYDRDRDHETNLDLDQSTSAPLL